MGSRNIGEIRRKGRRGGREGGEDEEKLLEKGREDDIEMADMICVVGEYSIGDD